MEEKVKQLISRWEKEVEFIKKERELRKDTASYNVYSADVIRLLLCIDDLRVICGSNR